MSELRPVAKGYEPGYPNHLTEEEIARLLRPSLWKRFGPATLAAGAVATGLSLGGCSSGYREALEVPPLTDALPRLSMRTNAKHKEAVVRIVNEVLGDKVGNWNEHTWLNLGES